MGKAQVSSEELNRIAILFDQAGYKRLSLDFVMKNKLLGQVE